MGQYVSGGSVTLQAAVRDSAFRLLRIGVTLLIESPFHLTTGPGGHETQVEPSERVKALSSFSKSFVTAVYLTNAPAPVTVNLNLWTGQISLHMIGMSGKPGDRGLLGVHRGSYRSSTFIPHASGGFPS